MSKLGREVSHIPADWAPPLESCVLSGLWQRHCGENFQAHKTAASSLGPPGISRARSKGKLVEGRQVQTGVTRQQLTKVTTPGATTHAVSSLRTQ